MASTQFLLYESATGYALFERIESEEVVSMQKKWQRDVKNFDLFSLLVKLNSYFPFSTKEMAVENVLSLAKGTPSDELVNFLKLNLPKTSSKKKKASTSFTLGVADSKLATSLLETMGVHCDSSDSVLELQRGIRSHFHRYVSDLDMRNVEKAQTGLAHNYSNNQIKFNLNRQDKMIIQGISWLEQMDKDINSFAMRVKEIYSIHFPELVKLVPDNENYLRCLIAVRNKEELDDDVKENLLEILEDEKLVDELLETADSSFGCDVEAEDFERVVTLAKETLSMIEGRKTAQAYLSRKMNSVAPNLTELLGELIGAKLISHAGSLSTLAKYPASTVQILGAEKALFRAIKTKGKTPKYGLLYGSTFIGKASTANKGRISRYLANKCSIASRIDCFSEGDSVSGLYGKILKEQVNERIEFYVSGKTPRKNVDAMMTAMEQIEAKKSAMVNVEDEDAKLEKGVTEKKKEKKRKRKAEAKEEADAMEIDETPKKKKKKAKEEKLEKKKSKKKRKAEK